MTVIFTLCLVMLLILLIIHGFVVYFLEINLLSFFDKCFSPFLPSGVSVKAPSPVIEIRPSVKDAQKPEAGYAWNPGLKFPPNDPCFCRSGLKFKKCCKLVQPLAIKKEAAIEVKRAIKALKIIKNA